MFQCLGIVARTVCAVVWLQSLAPQVAVSQMPGSRIAAEVSSEDPPDRLVADRYEKILRSRPQLGTALDKFVEFHERHNTLPAFREQLQREATEQSDGQLFQFLGLLQMQSGSSAEAAASFALAEQLLPSESLASLYRSRALSLNRQYGPALNSLQIAVDRKLAPATALEIAKELSRFGTQPGEETTVVEVGLKVVQQFPTHPQVIEKIAECFVAIGRPESAQPLYEKLIQLTREPQRRIELRMELARLKKRLGQPDQGLLDLEQLVGQVKPQSWLHTSLLGQIEQWTEELHGAEGLIAYYESWLAKRPQDTLVMLRMAKLLSNRAQVEDAKVWIRKAQTLAPTEPEPLLALMDLLEHANQIAEACDVGQQLIELDPTNADYIVRLGRLVLLDPSRELGEQRSAAAKIWGQLLLGHEQDPARLIQVAELLQNASLPNDAVKLVEAAVEVSGGSNEYRELLGERLFQLGRIDEARAEFASAVKAAGDNRESLISLSNALARLQFRDEALAALQKACERHPSVADLLRLAQLLQEAKGYEPALVELNRAAALTEDRADLDAVWDAIISHYQQTGSLSEQITAREKSLQGSEAVAVEALQGLALMQSANQQRSAAAATALKATALQPDSLRAWLLSARMEREAGLSLREIASLRELCKLDAPHAVDFMQRIAAIQFQLNQLEEALATAEIIFASPNAVLQHYQMASMYCQQAKKPEQAVEIMRRATRAFPTDRFAWLILSRQLMDLPDRRAAIEAAWRVLELSRDQVQQREAVELLDALHTAEPGVVELLPALAQFGLEQERENDAAQWAAWVLKDHEGMQGTAELITNVLKRNSVAPELLRTTVQLAVQARDYARAVEIQRRLCRADFSADNQLALGEWLAMQGDSEAAALEWQKVMRYRSNDAAVVRFAKGLIAKASWKLVADLVELGVGLQVDSWEFLASGIHANVQEKRLAMAAELADRLLDRNLPQDLLVSAVEEIEGVDEGVREGSVESGVAPATATDRLAWLEHSGVWQATLNEVDITRAGHRTHLSNPRASQAAAVRQLAVQRGATLRSTPTTRFSIQCYGDARALAVLAKFGKVNQQRPEAAQAWVAYVAGAIESKDIGQLWDCVLVMEPARSSAASFSGTGAIEYRDSEFPALNRYVEVLDALIAGGEAAAIELAISDIATRRQLQLKMAERLMQSAPAMEAKELARLQSLIQRGYERGVATALAWRVTLAIELMRSQQLDEGRSVLAKALREEKDLSQIALCSQQFSLVDPVAHSVTMEMLLRAFELELETGSVSNDLISGISAFRNAQRAPGFASQDLVIEMVRLQSQHLERLPPESLVSDSRANDSRQMYRSRRVAGVALPDRSSMLSASLLVVLREETAVGKLTPTAGELQPESRLGRAEIAVRWLCLSVSQAILSDPEGAIVFLHRAKEQKLGSEVLSLYEVWLLVAAQRVEQAVEVLEGITPPSEAILRECELWKMEIASRLGNRDEALRAARVLATLSLSVRESSEVAAVLNAK